MRRFADSPARDTVCLRVRFDDLGQGMTRQAHHSGVSIEERCGNGPRVGAARGFACKGLPAGPVAHLWIVPCCRTQVVAELRGTVACVGASPVVRQLRIRERLQKRLRQNVGPSHRCEHALDNTGLLGRFVEGLPASGDARHKGLARLTV